MQPQQPSIGRIVHYVLPEGPRRGEVRPAIIVRRFTMIDPHVRPNVGMCNLQVLLDGGNDGLEGGLGGVVWKGSVLYSEAQTPGTWHWPPRD